MSAYSWWSGQRCYSPWEVGFADGGTSTTQPSYCCSWGSSQLLHRISGGGMKGVWEPLLSTNCGVGPWHLSSVGKRRFRTESNSLKYGLFCTHSTHRKVLFFDSSNLVFFIVLNLNRWLRLFNFYSINGVSANSARWIQIRLSRSSLLHIKSPPTYLCTWSLLMLNIVQMRWR